MFSIDMTPVFSIRALIFVLNYENVLCCCVIVVAGIYWMMNKSMWVNLRKRTAINQIVSSVAKKYFPKELKRTLFVTS